MEGFRFGPSGKLGHRVDLSEEPANHFAGVLPLTKPVDLLHRSREGVLDLRNRDVGEVLALLLETMMMFQEFFAEEIREALTACAE